MTQHVVAACSHCFRQNPINVNFAACGMFSLYPPDGMTVCSIRFRAFQVKAGCDVHPDMSDKFKIQRTTYHLSLLILPIANHLLLTTAFSICF